MSRIRAKDLPEHVQRLIAPQLAKGKRARRAEWQGLHWDSEEERQYGEHLLWRQKAGEIFELDRQVRVDLHIGRRYMKIDFYYFDGRLAVYVWDEYKCLGWKRRTLYKDWKLKADIWAAGFGPGLLRITTPSQGGYHHEEIHPKPNAEALQRILLSAHLTMNPDEFGKILAGHKER